MRINTHGRWPLVGAAALPPVSVAAVRRPALRPLAALLWHQTEEWVWPGSFLPWINREVLGSDQDEFPLSRRTGIVVNVVMGWGLSLVCTRPELAPTPVTALYVSHFGNVFLHLSWAIRRRRYDPGVVTAVATLAPAAVIGLRELRANPRVSSRAMRLGVAQGAALSVALVPLLKWRLRRAH